MLEETNKLWKLADRRTGMNILICDDERFAAEKIAELVSRSAVQHHLAVSVVKYTDVEKCLASPLNRCDIAFFDIDMKPYNGIDLARKLHNENPNAIIIFVTNYIEYAPAGYEVNAFRYLLKPEMDKNFERIFEDALEAYKKNHQIVSFSIDAEHIEVPVHNILYLESEQRIMQIVKKIHPLKRASSIRWPILFLTFLFPLASFVVLLTLIFTSVNSPDNSNAFLLCGIFLVIANIAVFLLLDWVDSSDEAIKQKLALEQTVQLQAQNMEALGKAYSAQRKITHDFNSQLETIGCLLKSDDSKDAIEFVTALHAKQTTRSLLVNTHHPIVDALLNQKAYIAKDKNIQIHFEVNDLSNLQLDSVDITTILGNLLDNAIEACVIYGENSQIQVKVLLGNTLFFAIRNTCKPVKIIGEYIPTTKPNAQLHGFGLENVKTLLRKYNGEYAMEYDEGWFTFTGEIDNYPIL